jgi:hypothetical protein
MLEKEKETEKEKEARATRGVGAVCLRDKVHAKRRVYGSIQRTEFPFFFPYKKEKVPRTHLRKERARGNLQGKSPGSPRHLLVLVLSWSTTYFVFAHLPSTHSVSEASFG